MKVNYLLTLILLSGLMVSCSDALYRAYPKAQKNRGEAAVPEQKQRKTPQTVVPDEVLQNEQASARVTVKSPEIAAIEPLTVFEETPTAIPEADWEAMEAVPVNDDTLEVDQEEHDWMIYEAEKSEDLARQLRGWAIATLIGIFFYPIYLIGIIGGIVTIIRYNRLTYVSERSMARKRKAQNFFLVAAILPLALIALVLLLIFLAF